MIQIFTDGSAVHKVDGGWACIVWFPDRIIMAGGWKQGASSNQMELKAIIEGLRLTPEKHTVTVTSDSQYAVKGFNSWMHRWEKNDWTLNEKGDEVKNKDLWMELFALKKNRGANAKWIKSHVNSNDYANVLNNLCDKAATYCRKNKKEIYFSEVDINRIQVTYERYIRVVAPAS